MLIAESEGKFRTLIASRGKDPASLSPDEALALAFEFFEVVRADDALLLGKQDMGDALLFQWGIYPAFEGFNDEYFYLDLTRQFISQAEADDDAIFQLMCTFKYCPSDQLKELGSGNRWCDALDALPIFKQFAFSHPALIALRGCKPTKVEIVFTGV